MLTIPAFNKKYFDQFKTALENIQVTDADKSSISFDNAIEKIVSALKIVQREEKKIMMVGNGGSAGICSHMAVDYWKNGKIKATAFNDPSLLTCISNDYSYAQVFSVPIEMFANQGDVVYCISSSGKSENILKAAQSAREKGCTIITFSGFDKENPLRGLGAFNFYVAANAYGYVEILHNFIIHCILDSMMFCNDRVDIFNKNQTL